jgi:photoactive yellow protein
MSPSAYAALASQLGGSPEDFPFPLYVVDGSGRIVFCNRALAELVGGRAENLVGRLSLLLYPAEAAPAILMRRVRALLGDPLAPRLSLEMRRAGGGTFPVELTVTDLEDDGELVGRLAMVREVEKAKSGAVQPDVEYLLRLSPNQADALPYGLITLDPSGVVTGYNARESRFSGLARSRVVGRNFFLEIAPCTRVRAFAGLYRQMVETGAPRVAHFDFRFRFGSRDEQVSILMAYSREMAQGAIQVEPRTPAAG